LRRQKKIIEVIGLLDFVKDPKYVYEKYKDVKISDNFLLNIVEYYYNSRVYLVLTKLMSIKNLSWDEINILESNARYKGESNSINIYAGIIQNPFYYSENLSYCNVNSGRNPK